MYGLGWKVFLNLNKYWILLNLKAPYILYKFHKEKKHHIYSCLINMLPQRPAAT